MIFLHLSTLSKVILFVSLANGNNPTDESIYTILIKLPPPTRTKSSPRTSIQQVLSDPGGAISSTNSGGTNLAATENGKKRLSHKSLNDETLHRRANSSTGGANYSNAENKISSLPLDAKLVPKQLIKGTDHSDKASAAHSQPSGTTSSAVAGTGTGATSAKKPAGTKVTIYFQAFQAFQ